MIDHYDPHIVTAQDYYPFGMLSRVALPNSGVPYKFGFNGQMMNNEVKGGLGSSYTAQFWEYDSRIGRRWNLDPKPTTGASEYSTFNNNPILFSDRLGDTIKLQNMGVSSEKFAQTQQEIQSLRKHSRSFRRMYRDLDRSNQTWTFQITNNTGGGEDHNDPHLYRLGRNWRDENDNLGNQMLNRMSHYAHEFGHAWRRRFNLDPVAPDPSSVKTKFPVYISIMATKAEKERLQAENAKIAAENMTMRNDFVSKIFFPPRQRGKQKLLIYRILFCRSLLKLMNQYFLV